MLKKTPADIPLAGAGGGAAESDGQEGDGMIRVGCRGGGCMLIWHIFCLLLVCDNIVYTVKTCINHGGLSSKSLGVYGLFLPVYSFTTRTPPDRDEGGGGRGGTSGMEAD